MAVASILDTVRGHLEQVSDKVANYQNFDISLASRLKPKTVAETTRYLYRQVIKVYDGGVSQKVSMDNGDMGGGTGPVLKYFTAGFIYSNLGFMFTEEQRRQAEKDTQSRFKVVADMLGTAFDTMVGHDNIHLFGSGNGALTAAASARSGAVYTFNGASDSLNVSWLMKGMSVDVWDSTLATRRNSTTQGPLRIIDMDPSSFIVTLNATPDTSPGTTDRLVVANVDVYGPSAPTTLSSTWPGGGLTTASGLTGDSWRHGLQYVNRVDPAEYYLGQLKSGFTELLSNNVAAGGAALDFDHVEQIKEKLYNRWGDESETGLLGVINPRQMRKVMALGSTIVRNLAQGSTTNYVDQQPSLKYTQQFNISGIPHFVSRAQDKARIDYFREADWGRVQSQPPEYYKGMDGGTMFFPIRSTTTGNIKTAWMWYIVQGFDYVNECPGRGGYISGLAYA